MACVKILIFYFLTIELIFARNFSFSIVNQSTVPGQVDTYWWGYYYYTAYNNGSVGPQEQSIVVQPCSSTNFLFELSPTLEFSCWNLVAAQSYHGFYYRSRFLVGGNWGPWSDFIEAPNYVFCVCDCGGEEGWSAYIMIGSDPSVGATPLGMATLNFPVQNVSSSPQIAFCGRADGGPQGDGTSSYSQVSLQPGATYNFQRVERNDPCEVGTTNDYKYGILGMSDSLSASTGGQGSANAAPGLNASVPFPDVTNDSLFVGGSGQTNLVQTAGVLLYTNPAPSFPSPASFLVTNGAIDWTSVGGSSPTNAGLVDEAGFNSLKNSLDTLTASLLRSNGLLVSVLGLGTNGLAANGTGGTNNISFLGYSNVWVMNFPTNFGVSVDSNDLWQQYTSYVAYEAYCATSAYSSVVIQGTNLAFSKISSIGADAVISGVQGVLPATISDSGSGGAFSFDLKFTPGDAGVTVALD